MFTNIVSLFNSTDNEEKRKQVNKNAIQILIPQPNQLINWQKIRAIMEKNKSTQTRASTQTHISKFKQKLNRKNLLNGLGEEGKIKICVAK